MHLTKVEVNFQTQLYLKVLSAVNKDLYLECFQSMFKGFILSPEGLNRSRELKSK